MTNGGMSFCFAHLRVKSKESLARVSAVFHPDNNLFGPWGDKKRKNGENHTHNPKLSISGSLGCVQ